MVFTTEGFLEVAIESSPEWDLNPRPLTRRSNRMSYQAMSSTRLYLRALNYFVPTCAHFHLLMWLQPLTKYIEAYFCTLYCCFSLGYLTFRSIQYPKTNSCF